MFGRKSKPPSSADPVRPTNGVKKSEQQGSSASRVAITASGSSDGLEGKRRAAIAVRNSMAFARIVSVLMRSPHYRSHTLADLQWLVIPPLMLGSFRIAEVKSRSDGAAVPVAVAAWASVSEEIDKRISENLDKPLRLRPNEWRSGDILWLQYAVGDARVMPRFLKQLNETTFKDRNVKLRRGGQDGKSTILTLASVASAGMSPQQ